MPALSLFPLLWPCHCLCFLNPVPGPTSGSLDWLLTLAPMSCFASLSPALKMLPSQGVFIGHCLSVCFLSPFPSFFILPFHPFLLFFVCVCVSASTGGGQTQVSFLRSHLSFLRLGLSLGPSARPLGSAGQQAPGIFLCFCFPSSGITSAHPLAWLSF